MVPVDTRIIRTVGVIIGSLSIVVVVAMYYRKVLCREGRSVR